MESEQLIYRKYVVQPKALVLSGGGSRGNYHVGALLSLSETDTYYSALAGSSVGAVISAFLAQFHNPLDGVKKLYSLFQSLRNFQVFTTKFSFRDSNSLYSSSPLKRLIEGNIDLDKVRASGISLRIPVTVLNTGKTHIFTEKDDNLHEAILASCSIPLVFPPVPIPGLGFCIDGSVLRDAPLKSIIKLGIHDIDVISLNPRSISREDVGNGLKTVLFRTAELVAHSLFEKDLEALSHMNEVLYLRYGTKLNVRLLRPSDRLASNPLNFEGYKCAHMRDLGRRDAKNPLNWNFV